MERFDEHKPALLGSQISLDERVLDLPDQLLDLLPVGVYVCDQAGRIVRYNHAAAELWGCSPKVGDPSVRFCGSYRLHGLDGGPMPHAKCPMADVLATGHGLRDQEIVIERPDGARIVALANIAAIKDGTGRVAGAVNVFRESPAQRGEAAKAAQQLAAIVESSEDAILTKDLNGIITSWNQGATRLFGYTSEETIGKPITILIPPDRLDEEPAILARIRHGERVNHYDTVRRRKDGSLVDISLTISPVRNEAGKIVGASKIARNISERRRAQEQQHLLLREMNHRVKNLFAISRGIVRLSARSAKTSKELASAIEERLAALARAHQLTLPTAMEDAAPLPKSTTMHALIQTIVSPYENERDKDRARVAVSGVDVPVAGGAVTSFALLLNEFATNAAKYGVLSTAAGSVDVECVADNERYVLTWKERGGPPAIHDARREGFGSLLARATVTGQLDGEISRDWAPEGLTIRLSLPPDRLTG